MLVRKRCRHGPCRLQFLLLLLMLGCVLLMVAMLQPPPHAPHPAVTAQAAQRSPEAGYRLDFGESQEWVLEAEDEGQEYGPLEGLPPFISLREDQLLVAVASPRARRNKTQGRRGGSYRLIKQPSRRQDEEAPERDWAAEEEDGEVSQDELTPLSLEEAFSARIPLQRALPEVRHPLSRVVSPVIDVIDWKTFQYHPSKALQRGVLDWKLDFHWEPLPERERNALPSPISPIRSPVVPSGVVAIDRHYFQNTGAYDPLMSLQGGENLELSLKVWLCGGSVEILPCSRVGHIYRNQETHSPLDQEAALRNKVRIAETWLGSFKETFYRHSPEAFSLSKAEKPDFTERLQLQRRLGCRMFHWFLANIYPELYPSECRPRFSGKLHNTGLGFCVDCQAEGDILGCAMMLAPCSDSRQQQHLKHTGRKEIHFGNPQHLCFDVRREKVILQNCTEEGPAIHQQHWDFQENGMIVHILSGKCMEAVVQESSKDLYLRQCDGKASQLWRFDNVVSVDK
ncbi:polypeptide N-acetylgalactosaminyltransferase 15 isoform X3 [Ursus americanus]|uniref:polypeptide N-acetylgalactosaminyltransferase 15 isoform X3 n=1 Tax=Ursus americanus TaxID=9643 RepID=UPI001E67CB17|nr:polypeptide N-acetylgalactosaminyltransferase 15 isoform X3 [Ursus americanus]